MATQKIFLGTELKLNISISRFGDTTMDDYDFDVTLIGGLFKSASKVINKDSAKRVDADNYIICFDTADLGPGVLKCKVTAYLPDGDFQDGVRTEITEIDTGIVIVKSL